MPLTAYLVIAAQSFKQDLAVTQEAHRKLVSATIEGSAEQRISGRTTRNSFTLKFIKPDRVLLRIREPSQHGRAASDRSYHLAGRRFIAYDHRANQVIGR